VHPDEAGVAVVHRARIRRLRGQAVLHRHAGAAEQRAPAVEPGVIAAVVAEHEAAAVHPVHARQQALGVDRTVQPDDHAAGTGNVVVGALDVVAELRHRELGHRGAGLGEGVVAERGHHAADVDRQLRQRGGDVGVERGSGRLVFHGAILVPHQTGCATRRCETAAVNRYVLFYESADDVLSKAPQVFPAHLERLKDFKARGELLLVGTFADPQADGSMAVFASREGAESFATGDPFVLQGVIRSWQVREWFESSADL
jgi:uncharacterized protein YciI